MRGKFPLTSSQNLTCPRSSQSFLRQHPVRFSWSVLNNVENDEDHIVAKDKFEASNLVGQSSNRIGPTSLEKTASHAPQKRVTEHIDVNDPLCLPVAAALSQLEPGKKPLEFSLKCKRLQKRIFYCL